MNNIDNSESNGSNLGSEEPKVSELVPDRVLAGPMVNQIMEALKQSDEAAYRVWLLLGNKYGSMQRVV